MKARLNPMVDALSGQVNKLVFREVRGRMVVARKPIKSNKEVTSSQIEHRERFKDAALYGKSVMAKSDVRAVYDAVAKEKNMPVFALTIADFFNAPVIHKVDVFGYSGNIGDTINIRASDDVGVVKVHVSISKPDGDPIEHGEAVETDAGSGEWVYTATVQGQPVVKIQAVAMDRPGGTAIKNIDKTF